MRYKRNDNYIVNEVAGDMVLIPVSNSVADMGSMLVLNETSVFILECMELPVAVEDIVAEFQTAYDCPDEAELRGDIMEFLSQMINRGFVSIID